MSALVPPAAGAGTIGPVDVALAAVLLWCAATDLRTGRIRNAVTYPAIVAGFAFALVGAGPGLSSSVLGFLAAGLPFFALFAAGWMGGGDVKLMAAVGAIKGYPFVLDAMFYAIFAGGLFAALALIWQGALADVGRDLASLARRAFVPGAVAAPITPRGGSFPFGVAIAIGVFAALAAPFPR